MPERRHPSPRDEHLSQVELPDTVDQEHFNQLELDDEPAVSTERPLYWRWLAALLVLFFIVYFGGQWFSWWSGPNLSFLQDSAMIREERNLQQATRAVVEVESFVPGTQGSRRGSGFNVLSEGLILTNAHLVEDSRQTLVSFPDGRQYYAQRVAIHASMDLAVLEINAEDLPVIAAVWTELPQVGESLSVVGNPLGFPRVAVAVTMLGMATLDNGEMVYVLDGPIYPGSSGSPVINSRGQAVAVVFAVLSSDGNGIRGLAVPIGHLQDIW